MRSKALSRGREAGQGFVGSRNFQAQGESTPASGPVESVGKSSKIPISTTQTDTPAHFLASPPPTVLNLRWVGVLVGAVMNLGTPSQGRREGKVASSSTHRHHRTHRIGSDRTVFNAHRPPSGTGRCSASRSTVV